MASKNVGSVIVIKNGSPAGIITDRDIVIRVVNKGLDPSTLKVQDVMTIDPLCLNEDIGVFEALEIVKGKGVRRYPVIDKTGKVVGIVILDDILYLIGKEMCDITQILIKSVPNL
jgi:CBS domain-containing protein